MLRWFLFSHKILKHYHILLASFRAALCCRWLCMVGHLDSLCQKGIDGQVGSQRLSPSIVHLQPILLVTSLLFKVIYYSKYSKYLWSDWFALTLLATECQLGTHITYTHTHKSHHLHCVTQKVRHLHTHIIMTLKPLIASFRVFWGFSKLFRFGTWGL